MAMGVPALAGPVPSYYLLLGDGKGGKICYSLEEWESYIEQFINNHEIRHKWRNEAIQSILPFLTPKIAQQINNLIYHLVNHK
jgi:glycosyltransferase involved in cell wall biosynthesis